MQLILCIVLLFLAIPRANAAEIRPQVVDRAGVLTAEQRQELEKRARECRERFQMDVVIVTVPNLGGKSPRDFADDYFDDHGYGVGNARSGALLLVAKAERNWYLSTSGGAIDAFNRRDIEKIGDIVTPHLANNAFYAAFVAYLDALPAYLNHSRTPNLLMSVVFGLVAGAAAVFVMISTMNTRRQQRGASSYLTEGSFSICGRQDLFLYSSVSKTARPQNTSGSGGGSSVHQSASGRSHGGGGGSF